MMDKLTAKEKSVLVFIDAYIREEGTPPSIVDIANGLDFNYPSSAQYYRDGFIERGIIEVVPNRARGIRITDAGRKYLKEV